MICIGTCNTKHTFNQKTALSLLFTSLCKTYAATFHNAFAYKLDLVKLQQLKQVLI